MRVPFTIWYGEKPNLGDQIPFVTPDYAFRYRSETVPGKRFLPRTVFGHFVDMDSSKTLIRVYHPAE